MSPLPAAVRFANPMQQLVNDINRIVGPQNLRALFIPQPSDGPVSQDRAVPSRVWTHNALPVFARYTKQGKVWLLSFDGSTQYLTTPDADDLSFGNSLVDTPFSVFSVQNVTDTAAARAIICKDNEWRFLIIATDALRCSITDNSAAVAPPRITDAAITQGVLTSLAATYTAVTGGLNAANDITNYQNGAVFASTATAQAGYVAMENLAALPSIGAEITHASNFFQGQIGLVLLTAIALSAAQVADLHRLMQRYFGV